MFLIRQLSAGVVALVALLLVANALPAFAGSLPLADRNGDGQILILAFGDSLTAGTGDGREPRETPPPPAGYPARLEWLLGIPVGNAGRGGERTGSGADRIPGVLALAPFDYVFIQEGANNVSAGTTDVVVDDLESMVDSAIQTGALPILGTLFPNCCDRASRESAVRSLNVDIRALTTARSIPLVDFHAALAPSGTFNPDTGWLHVPEGLHPTVAGYDVLGNAALDVFSVRMPIGDRVGVFDPASSSFTLRRTLRPDSIERTFGFSPTGAGWLPITGDWNGDGVATVGLYDPAGSKFHLRNSQFGDVTDLVYPYGPAGAGWIAISGDWNGDGIDTVGLYDPVASAFYLRNSHAGGVADAAFAYGAAGAGWKPLAGDWDGDGVDTVGLYDPASSIFYLKNSLSGGNADVAFAYGPAGAGWKPVTGDWNGDGLVTIGLFDPASATFFLRQSNTGGFANRYVVLGAPGSAQIGLGGAWTAY